MAWMDCNKPENATPERALAETKEAIEKVSAAFGSPGSYGYGHPKGDALQHLYAAQQLVQKVLKSLVPQG